MLFRLNHLNKRSRWLGKAGVAVTLLLAALLLSGSLAPRVTRAAPPAQDNAAVCTLLRSLESQMLSALPAGDKVDPLESYLAIDPRFAIQSLYGGECEVHFTDKGGLADEGDVKAQQYTSAEGAQKGLTSDGYFMTIPRTEWIATTRFGDPGFGWTHDLKDPISLPRDIWLHSALFVRGCYVIATNRHFQDPEPVRKLADVVYAKLKTMPPCPSAQPPAAPLSISHGCSYNEPGISQGQVVCVANASNASPGADITYKWTLDDQVQPETGPKFTRSDKDLSAGEHTLVIAVTEAKSSPLRQDSSSYKFTKAGPVDLSVAVQCALVSDDDHAVACYADPKNAPAGATLTYEWTWGGKQDQESSRTLNKTKLADGVYNISVRAKDSSGKYTAPATTSITVGKPSSAAQPPAANPPASSTDGQLQIKKPDGTTTTVQPGQTTRVELSRDDKLELLAACGAQVLNLIRVKHPDWFTPNEHLNAKLGIALYTRILCENLLSALPRQVAYAGNSKVFDFPASFAGAPAAQIQIEVEEGAVEFEVTHDKAALDVETATTKVSAQGKNTFAVTYDLGTNTSNVGVSQGQVTIQPKNPALAPTTLQASRQVTITQNTISAVSAIPTPGTDLGGVAALAVCGGVPCLGVIALFAGIVTFTRSRRKQARPAAPRSATPPLQHVPPPPPLPRAGPPPPSSLPERAPTPTWVCSKCKTSNRAAARFCSKCGTPR